MIGERKRVLNKITFTMEQNSTMVPHTESSAAVSASCSSNHIGRRGSSKTTDKYSLRPRTVVRRLQQVDRSRDTSSFKTSEPKASKSRPPPLSKYRRKTANARERHRMKEINDAFETLRRILPDFCSSRVVAASTMTKITTLRLAASYIRALSHILEDGRRPGNINFLGEIHLEHTLPAQHLPQPPTAFPGNTNAHTLQSHTSEESANVSPLASFSSSSLSPSSSFTNSSPTSSSSSSYPPFSHLRCSFGSSSDLSDLLSDDSCCVLDDNLDLFDDIPPLPEADPFALLLAPDGAMQVPES
ncbi:helix-loop-helix protein delilah-like [Eriocheir sinensis]|uniref:helix-loop-helix protein delilah-like n=1 Tax=Eriocheir sinensis TaxID=95602 RepID=UPI0021C6CF5C|nr:helix-loop-helix protein delilah-like [Eriocheir sinensis]